MVLLVPFSTDGITSTPGPDTGAIVGGVLGGIIGFIIIIIIIVVPIVIIIVHKRGNGEFAVRYICTS